MISYPNIHPVAFTIFGWPIRWYGLMYLIGIWMAWLYARFLAKRYFSPLKAENIDDFVPWAVLGILIGGRLGYVLFYDLIHSFYEPWTIFATWRGGMAFHGGVIGVGFAVLWYVKKKKIPLLRFADCLACATPIGIFFGRIGNFINQEVYGRVTQVSWSMVFPAVDHLPRHPSQLYEAFFEGVVLLVLLGLLVRFLAAYRGALTGLFLMGYGLFRSLCEIFRVPDAFYSLGLFEITQGQLLSLPMIFAGCWLFILSLRRA